MIINTPTKFSYTLPQGLSAYVQEIVHYTVNAYGFLLPMNQNTSWKEFADIISKYYSLKNPQNKEVVRVLQGLKS